MLRARVRHWREALKRYFCCLKRFQGHIYLSFINTRVANKIKLGALFFSTPQKKKQNKRYIIF